MKFKLDIIIPVYHEQNTICKMLDNLEKRVRTPHRLLIVYDYDKDPTIPVINSFRKRVKNITLVKNLYGKGIVNALKTGFKKSTSEYIIVTMADSSDNPDDIDKMVKELDMGYDLVCASRYIKGGSQIGGPFIKSLLSRLAGKSLHILTGIQTHDVTSAFKAYRKSLIDKIKIESKGGFEISLEITVKAYKYGMRITEIPTTWRDRTQGKSKFKVVRWLPYYIKWYLYAVKNKFSILLF